MKLLVPYTEGALLGELQRDGKILSEEYTGDGVLVDALVDRSVSWKAAPFMRE